MPLEDKHLATDDYGLEEAQHKVASANIIAHPDLKAILCANDSMALGAMAAVKSAGKTDSIFIVGFDNIAAAQRALKEGKLLCTIDQHADKLAVFGIEYALEMHKEYLDALTRAIHAQSYLEFAVGRSLTQ